MKEFLEEKSKEINDLLINLEELNENIDLEVKGHPPIWNEDISDIKQFIDNLKEWFDKPRLKEIKDIISYLKKSLKDTRDFKIDNFSTYYLEIYDEVIEAKNIINDSDSKIKGKITSIILDSIILQTTKEELDSLLENIESLIDEINENIFNLDPKESEFLKLIKKEIESEVFKSINEQFGEITKLISDKTSLFTKASNLLKLAPIISEEILIKEYNKVRNIDEIWGKCDKIRILLDQTEIPTFNMINKSDYDVLLKIKTLQNDKEEISEMQDLSEIIKKLNSINDKIEEIIKELRDIYEDITDKLLLWIKILDDPKFTKKNDLLEECKTIIKNIEKFELEKISNLNDIDFMEELKKLLDKFNELKKIVENFLKSNINEDAKKILEDLDNIDKIKKDLGDNFWNAIKELSNSFDNIKIKIEWES